MQNQPCIQELEGAKRKGFFGMALSHRETNLLGRFDKNVFERALIRWTLPEDWEQLGDMKKKHMRVLDKV